jgi:microcystin-dependent protein
MMLDPLLGEIDVFAFNFAPKGFALCNGQLLPINQNQALFALLGTTYGGNGQTTFALPDLRGRLAIGYGQGPGLPDYSLGERSGSESVTLLATEMAAHTHAIDTSALTATARCRSGAGDQRTPAGNVPAAGATPASTVYSSAAANATMAASAVTVGGNAACAAAGGGQAHENRQPFLVLNYCVALQGIFPSRN